VALQTYLRALFDAARTLGARQTLPSNSIKEKFSSEKNNTTTFAEFALTSVKIAARKGHDALDQSTSLSQTDMARGRAFLNNLNSKTVSTMLDQLRKAKKSVNR
jgi:hypothetical protein